MVILTIQNMLLGRTAQSIAHQTREPDVLGTIPDPATYFRFSFADSRRALVSYWRKNVHEVLTDRLGGLSLSRKSVVWLNDHRHPDMTIAANRGHNNNYKIFIENVSYVIHIILTSLYELNDGIIYMLIYFL